DNGGNWSVVEIVGPDGFDTQPGWSYHECAVESLIPLTAETRVRFVASDFGADSIVDAAIDDFRVRAFACDGALCRGDITGDRFVDLEDLAAMVAGYGHCAPDPEFRSNGDFDGDGCFTLTDLTGLLGRWAMFCP
ncbi:MAG: hypothetical protein KDA32_15210, partial [Phycisphaerales bacterium]|nr:hypothetical protein [Phycisphaerales bacterium]